MPPPTPDVYAPLPVAQQVVLTDIRIPFSQIVVLVVRFWLATVVAALILAIPIFLVKLALS